MQKNADAFRTISEVADELALPQHVLRFWETRFPQIRPLKRAGGRRYYRPADINLLKSIRALLYDEGYTIKGVQRLLKEQGPKHVIASAPAGGEAASLDQDDGSDLEIVDDDDGDMPVPVAPNPPPLHLSHASAREPVPAPQPPSVRDEPAPIYKPQRPAPPEPGLLGSLQRDALEAALMVVEDCERILAPLRRRSA